MKLPEFQGGYTPSFRMRDPYTPIRVQAARTEALNKLTGAAEAIYWDMEKRQSESEAQKASLSLTKVKDNWDAKYKNADYVRGDDPALEDLDIKKTEVVTNEAGQSVEQIREQIPAYEVKAALLRKALTAAATEQSQTITNNIYRTKWLENQMQNIEEVVGRQKVSDIKEQKIILLKEQKTNIDEALDNQRYGMAVALTKSSFLTEDEKKAKTQEIYKRQETDMYDMSIADGSDRNEMVAYVQFLESDENYMGRGTLNVPERAQYIRMFKAAIARLDAKESASEEANDRILRDRIRAVVNQLDKGENVNVKEIRLVDTLAAQKGDKFLLERVQIANALKSHEQQAVIAALPLDQDEQYLENLQTLAERSNYSGWDLENYQNAKTLVDKKREGLQQNPLQWGIRAGIIGGLEDLDFGNSESIAKRINQAETVSARYGIPVPYLTDSEVAAWGSRIQNADAMGRMAFIRQIEKDFGTRSPVVYEQLQLKGVTPIFTIAGMVTSQGDERAAMKILEGFHVSQERDDIVKATGNMIDVNIQDQLGPSLAKDPTRYKATSAAIKAVYYGLAADAGYVGPLDMDMLEQATETVVGGQIIEYEGSYIFPPVRGMTSYQFENWIEELDNSYIKKFGNPLGRSPGSILNDIRTGDIMLVEQAPGYYYMYDHSEDAIIWDIKKKQPIVIEYDPNAPKKPTVPPKKRAPGKTINEDVTRSIDELLNSY